MKVYINERSIDKQAETLDEAIEILSQLAKTVVQSRGIAYESKAYRTRCFSDRLIMPDLSVKEVLVKSSEIKSAADEVARKLTLETLLKRPFTEPRHTGELDEIKCSKQECLKDSCIDDAAESLSGSLLISAIKNPRHSYTSISYTSSIYGHKTSINLWNEEMLHAITWKYEHNEKHHTQARILNGEEASEMDLNLLQAQKTLTNGVKVNNRIYGYCNGSWYQFNRHTNNNYHGFKIALKSNFPDHDIASKLLAALNYNECGQVFT